MTNAVKSPVTNAVKSPVKKALTIAVVLAALAGCAGSDGSTPSPSPSPTSASPTSTSSPGPAPTADQISWAGNVCSDTTALQSQVQGLASAAATAGTGVVTAISDQMKQISTSTGTLIDTVKAAPSATRDDPGYADVQSSTDKVDTSLKALQNSASTVEGTTGAALVKALGTVVIDTGTMLTDVAATVKAITASTQDASSTLGQAFRAAPDCAALTAT